MNSTEIDGSENSALIGVTTNETTTYSQISLQHLLWLISLLISIVLSIVALWLVATIGFYGFKTGKFYSKKQSSCSECTMLRIMFSGAIFILPRLATTNILVWFGWESSLSQNQGCEIVIDISYVFYFLSLLHVGLFLWFRQRYLYLQPSLQRLYSMFIKVLSWGCITLIFLSGIGFVLYMTIPQMFQASSNGCVKIKEDKRLVNYLLAGMLVLSEFVLIFLFIYPLYRHRRPHWISFFIKAESKNSPQSEVSVSKSTAISTVSVSKCNRDIMKSSNAYPLSPMLDHKDKSDHKTISNPTMTIERAKKSRSAKTGKKILSVMQRSVICACVCMISDVLAFVVVSLALPKRTVRSFRHMFYDINLVVNVLSLMFSFESYKKIFFAFFIGKSSSSKSFSPLSFGTSGNKTSETTVRMSSNH